jgi:NADP-dependent 3-hydroxy acid dehydrogenase YdfG
MTERNLRPVAVITGASSGIGAATADRLAADGFELVLGARRKDRLEEVAERTGGRALELDVTDAPSVAAFVDQLDRVNVLVNNAGLALGRDTIEELDEDDVRTMWETNVMGVLRMTRGLLPKIEASGNGHIVNVGSTAAIEVYPAGGGYTTSKHALRVISRTLRLELVGRPIRVTEIDPGLVETEFSIVRFSGDEQKAAAVYKGLQPLVAEDIADCIGWAVTRPPHVNIDQIVVRPRSQATSTVIARDED